MSTSILSRNSENTNTTHEFDPTFRIQVGAYSTAIVEPDTEEGLIALTFGNDGERYLSPAEGLSLAAALQAVSTFLLEEPRVIRRTTEAGAPRTEELHGVGL